MAGDKYLFNNQGTVTEKRAVQTSSGAASAGNIPALGPTGRFDNSMMPVGIGADTGSILTSEALSAGDLVNVWNNSGTANVRRADGTVAGKEAHGFVLSAFDSGTQATVFFEGTNTQMSSLTPGVQFLNTTAGKSAPVPPTGSGNVSQVVGFAISTTAMNFQAEPPIVLA